MELHKHSNDQREILGTIIYQGIKGTKPFISWEGRKQNIEARAIYTVKTPNPKRLPRETKNQIKGLGCFAFFLILLK